VGRVLRVAFDANPLLATKTGVGYYTERLVAQLASQYHGRIELIGFYFDFLGRKDTANLPHADNISYRPIRFTPDKVVHQLLRRGVRPSFEFFVPDQVDFILFNNFWGYASKRGTPSAPVVHDLAYLDLSEYVSKKNRKDLARMIPEQIKRSDFVITVSEFSKQRLVEAYDIAPKNVLVTPIPPPEPYKPKGTSKLTALGITKPFILFVGTVEPRKNIVTLVDAYEQLPQKIREHYQLVIAGRVGWNCEAEIARLEKAKQQGLQVLHLGYVDDDAKAELYQKTALFVSASRYEGFGMPVLEAMSYGAPCAVSDIPVFREVASEVAVFFDPQRAGDIAQTITKVLDDPERPAAMQRASAKQAATLQWPKVAQSVFDAINAHVV
jgi:glycosyltransferase involved in cell wall biosynthesis